MKKIFALLLVLSLTVMAFSRSPKPLKEGQVTQGKNYFFRDRLNPINGSNDVSYKLYISKDVAADEYKLSVSLSFKYATDKSTSTYNFNSMDLNDLELCFSEISFLDNQIKKGADISDIYMSTLNWSIFKSDTKGNVILAKTKDFPLSSVPGFVKFFSQVLDDYDSALADFKKTSVKLSS